MQLLARGGARYVMHEQMTQLRDMGLYQVHAKSGKLINGKMVGQWAWHPTDAECAIIAEKEIAAHG